MMKKSFEAETMSKVNQFAFNFKPTFQASTLFSLCNFPSEKTEIKFVLDYWPFSKYKPNKKVKSQKTKIRHEDKEFIKSELQNQFSSGSIQFDDESLMDKVSENFARSSCRFQPGWDEDSNETKFEERGQETPVDINNNETEVNIKVSEGKVNENLAISRGGFQPGWDEYLNVTNFEERRQENSVDINNNETEASISLAGLQASQPINDDDDDISTFNVQEQIYQDKCNYELEKYKTAANINISTERGKKLEPNIIKKINIEENMNFVQKKSLKSIDFGHFWLCGIIDGIDAEKKTLIEVKTRKSIDVHKRTIDLKDKLQCLAYLKLTGCERCLLIESGPNGQQKKIFIDWDESEFKDRIINRLSSFVIKYRNMKEREFRVKLRRYKF